MTLEEIKKAVDEGETVHWSNSIYIVEKNKFGDYYILCKPNKHEVMLTWTDGVTMNGKEEDFYIER